MLAIDLIALMINENIESRPAINEILKSPYFWSPKKKLEFFFDIRKILDLKDEMANNLRDEIDHFASVIEEDWTQNLSFDVMEDINKTMRKHDKGMISDLLRFIRNKVIFCIIF